MTPVRQCMGCRNRFPKAELIRVVRSPAGDVSLDTKSKAQGRGVYLCRDAKCYKRVRKSRALERMLKSQVFEEIFAEIEGMFTNADALMKG